MTPVDIDENITTEAHRLLSQLHQRRSIRVAKFQYDLFQNGKAPSATAFLPPTQDDLGDVHNSLRMAVNNGLRVAMGLIIPCIDSIDSDKAKGREREHLNRLNSILEQLRALARIP